MNKSKNILVVASHPDDEVLGCGGTLYNLKKKGAKISVLFLSDGESSRKHPKINKLILERKKQATEAARILGVQKIFFGNFPDNSMDSVPLLKIIQFIEKHIKKIKPDTIFTHFESDLNVDHQITSKAVITACRPIKNQTVKSILFFEILSSSEWNISIKNKSFKPNYFVDISKSIKFKLKALKQYKREMRTWPHPRSIEGVKLLSKTRGSSVGLSNAEAFILGRYVEK
jgi:LmbE family N-acetylglucosaminyl deacetylase|tara:strand:+ start:232 stop:918 length:687 start_codon:yes stop_codon:yes gene_type:complete